MRKLTMSELGRKTVDEFKAARKIPVVVVLDNVRSMHNVGSVFRTSDAFLLHSVILCGYTPQPPHRDIQKSALGATESVDWLYFEHTSMALDALQEDGFSVFAVEQTQHSIQLNNMPAQWPGKTALIFGNEVTGVDQQIIARCTGVIEIPQAGFKHSLNISVAAGIVLWEAFKHFAEHPNNAGSAVPLPQQNHVS